MENILIFCGTSLQPPIRGPDRVARIKQEEIHLADRERQHERYHPYINKLIDRFSYMATPSLTVIKTEKKRKIMYMGHSTLTLPLCNNYD